MKKLNNEELLAELEVPFPFDQVLWRVTNTANNRTRGQVSLPRRSRKGRRQASTSTASWRSARWQGRLGGRFIEECQ
jgi:hypothetical protein